MMTLELTIAGVRLRSGDKWDLIQALCDQRAVQPLPNAGQVALADWLLSGCPDDKRRRAMVSAGGIVRFLTAETQPSEDAADWVAEVTEGAVRPPMWLAPTQNPAAVRPQAAVGRTADRHDPDDRPSEPPRAHARITGDIDLLRRQEGIAIVDRDVVMFMPDPVARALAAGIASMLGAHVGLSA